MTKLKQTLRNTILLGLNHNIDFLNWVLQEGTFEKHQHHTAWVKDSYETFQSYIELKNDKKLGQTLCHLAEVEEKSRPLRNQVSDDDDVWLEDPWKTVQNWGRP